MRFQTGMNDWSCDFKGCFHLWEAQRQTRLRLYLLKITYSSITALVNVLSIIVVRILQASLFTEYEKNTRRKGKRRREKQKWKQNEEGKEEVQKWEIGKMKNRKKK